MDEVLKIIDNHQYIFDGHNVIIRNNNIPNEKFSLGIIINTAFTIPPKTGVCYRLYYLSKELSKNGIGIKLFICNRNYNDDVSIKQLLKEKEIDIHIIPESIFYDPNKLLKIVKGAHVDAMQFEDSETAILVGRYLKEKLKIPLFIELHDSEILLKKTLGGYRKSDIALSEFIHFVSGKIADLVIAMTNNDFQNFVDIGIPVNKLVLSPNGIDPKFFPYYGPNLKQKNIIFIGNLFYKPNLQAVNIMINKFIPKLEKLNPTMIFVGMAPNELINKYRRYKNVKFTGTVNNINQELKKATLALCPTITGAGMKVKILNFAAAGLPIISTSIGASGYETLKGLILENNLNKFPAVISKLIQSPHTIKRLGRQNRMDIVRNFNLMQKIGFLMVMVFKSKVVPGFTLGL